MSSQTQQENLVSSRAEDDAQLFDPAFINAWGLALRPAGLGGHWWITNTDTSRVTLYIGDSETVPFGQDGLSVIGVPGASDGTPVNIVIDPPTQNGVQLPPPNPTPATVLPPSNPTGQVFSGSNTDFLVDGTSLTGGTLTDAPARFITVSEDGTIAAWGETGSSPDQRMNAFSVVIDNSDTGAIYKGVTVSGDSGSGNLLYAANFSQGRIDVFDATWQPVETISFVPEAPGGRNAADFAPFNVERVFDASIGRDVLIVAYAKVANAAEGEEEPTDGFIAKFDLDGTFIMASDAGGLFNAPWGVALAPDDFGAYSGSLLVGNFGDGRILALDIESLEPEGYLLDADGAPVTIDGLWDLAFGNGESLGRSNSLYFAAGPEEESHGLFGSLSVTEGDDVDGFFQGTQGNDVHSGASGDDVIRGGRGADTLMGQLGDDLIDGGDGADKLFGGAGDDVVNGGDGADQLSGGRGDDLLRGGDGADVLNGGSGKDRLFGGDGKDVIDGGADADVIYGGDGKDSLNGGDGADRLLGGDGRDTLTGGMGDDFLDGGKGRDVFVFAGQFGDDRIADFDAYWSNGQDLIDFSAYDLTSETFASRVEIDSANGNTVITIDGGGTITLLGVCDAGAITLHDFIL
jgi:uncharacterized protein (TIGR03118 family)